MEQRKFIYPYRVPHELYHHGILGQKWGKRNGPPYPLGSGDHSASEKKAGWRKSLDKGGSETSEKPKRRFFNRSAARRPNTKETPKAESGKKSSDDGKKESSRKSGMNPFANMDEAERQRMMRIARNVAIGTVVVGAILGGAYLKNKYDTKDLTVTAFLQKHANGILADEHFNIIGEDESVITRFSHKLSRTPMSELSDKDSFIKAGSEFQRIIKSKSAKEGLLSEKVQDVMYAAFTENDKNIYYHQIGADKDKGLKNFAVKLKAANDIKLPSERKRVETFVKLMEDPAFREE